MRGSDNWLNSFDYLKNQILVYDYNNPIHFHILKMKFWVLDDSIRVEENLIDNDVKNPLNHRESLKNELIFLDKYIRTKDKKLEKNEDNYYTLVRNRKSALRDFTSRKNPETNEKYKDWEQDYSSRPSLLTDNQFDQLYYIYKRKENIELKSAFEILDKIDNMTIDNRTYQQENAIRMYKEPSESEALIKENAIKEKQKEDVHFVWEMNRAHDEIISQILDIKPDIEKEIEKIEGPKEELPPLGPTDPPRIITTVSDASIVICNFPTIRDNVGENKNDPSHRGMIIEQLGTGGYRFYTKAADLKTYFKLPDEILNPDDKNNTEILTYINEMNIFLEGEVEWDFNNWEYGMFCTITETVELPPVPEIPDTPTIRVNTEEPEPAPPPKVTITLKKLNINKTSLNNINRFNELCKRWMNINELRERQMMLTGIRVQLESMFNASVPNMRSQMEKVFRDRKEEKLHMTSILKDFCLFSEFK